MRGQHHVDRGVAVRVRVGLHVILVRQPERLIELGLRDEGWPRQRFWPSGPGTSIGSVKKAVRACGDPSTMVFTPPSLRWFSYFPNATPG